VDCGKVGALLYGLRREKGMTQKQVAQYLNISDKAVSKWERGLGFPDVSLLSELSALYGVKIESILGGNLEANRLEAGNLKRVRFYVCPVCGNIVYNTGKSEISCCGRKLAPLIAQPADAEHAVSVEDTDGQYYVTFNHAMSKAHFLSFVAYVANDRVLLVKLYPEQEASVFLPKLAGGKLPPAGRNILFFYCTQHGLFSM